MRKPSSIGKRHVVDVGAALKRILINQSIDEFSEPVIQTAKYIWSLYPSIYSVTDKFELSNPDEHPDLTIKLHDGRTIELELFLIKGNATIQPKNLGAKSFLAKYFKSNELQLHFNRHLHQAYKEFLFNIISTKQKTKVGNLSDLRKVAKQHFPKFDQMISTFRMKFLFELREYCFELLKNEYNTDVYSIEHAFNELMMTKTTNIITRYGKGNKCLCVERWKSTINSTNKIEIYKKGNDVVGIRSGNEALTLRFKFESSPTSSIKLATSYELFPEKDDIVKENLKSINKFEKMIEQHKQEEFKNKSNAIGKCNEAIVYYRILKMHPEINQVDKQIFEETLITYSPRIPNVDLINIKLASEITVMKIKEYLSDKYDKYNIDSIQLVGDSYLKNRLDTSDLQLILVVKNKYIVESFSLKAISKWSSKITTKNPGIGKILGTQYFDIGTLEPTVKEVKQLFDKELLNHKESLVKVSNVLGQKLKRAPQQNLKKGIISLIGNSTIVLTIYSQNECMIVGYQSIQDDVEVLPNTPTNIQTSLLWNNSQELLTLRVKFSASQSKGWSSLKLACDYKVKMIDRSG